MLVSNQPILETSLPSLTKNLWFLCLGHFHADSPISSKKLERIRELEALGKKEQTLVCFWRRVIPGTPNNGSQYGKGLPLSEVPENPTWFLLDWKLGWWQLFVDVLSVNNYIDPILGRIFAWDGSCGILNMFCIFFAYNMQKICKKYAKKIFGDGPSVAQRFF